MRYKLLIVTGLLTASLILCACHNSNHSEQHTVTEPIPSTDLLSPENETIPLTNTQEQDPIINSPTNPPEPTHPPAAYESGVYYNYHYDPDINGYLNYFTYIPENAQTQMPLMIYLHGDGEVDQPYNLPEYGLSQLIRKVYGDEFPFILLEPNTRIKSWTSDNIPQILMSLIERVCEEYEIDRDRIMITGHSRGAIGVWDMISIYGGYFSAAVPVSSPHQEGHINYLKAAEVPVWTFAGDVGDIERWYHKYLAQNVDQIYVSGGYGKFTVLEGCDHGKAKIEAYVKDTFEWMLSQKRGIIPEITYEEIF